MSAGFGPVDFDHLIFPSSMHIDYIRVYQPSDAINVGCNPKDFPTTAYINAYELHPSLKDRVAHLALFRYIEAYTNPNLTTWVGDFNQPWPKNSLVTGCS